MNISLKTALPADAARILELQRRAFQPLLDKYEDYDTSPATETLDRVMTRITEPGSACHMIMMDGSMIGMLRVKRAGEGAYRVGPVFVAPEHQGKGAAQAAFRLIEQMYADARVWTLTTILEEAGNCRLYEKLGYTRTGEYKKINERMTFVGYERRVPD